MSLITIRALDSDFKLITAIKYINLQWNRRYYAYGDFSIKLAAKDYSSDMSYIYSPDRPEVGIIQQRTITQSSTGDFVQLSGYFLEKMLDDKIIYPVFNFSGNIETGARQMFSSYKEDIPAVLGEFNNLGSSIQFQETGSELGKREYELLATQELSYRLYYDFITNQITFGVYQGVDRTDTQIDNPRVAFSRRLGNVPELICTQDSSNAKNYAVIAGEGEGSARVVTYLDHSEGGYKKKLWVDAKDLRSDDLTSNQYIESLKQRGAEKLLEHQVVEDFDLSINPRKLGRAYLDDYDLGDKCDVNVDLDDLALSYTARITEISEVIKNNNWSVKITVGNKLPTNLQKAKR